ncbi:MAG: choice-of-anchor D domain-containing protein [candidate division KSB1 bacterium]|nr:choice-of-anchor D domain-containing protein [candidate division KSB1 bacterium]MDZ7318665.1 choice-of-anchor D domain-containing protein [candidate division KSB1 bacterium]
MKPKELILTVLILNFLFFLNYTPFVIGAGIFDFNDGTTQGWTLDQMYVTADQTKFTPVIGYTLTNSNNQLLAYTGSLLIGRSDQNDIYLESPDLSSNSNWQGISGYSIDITRLLYSPGFGDLPNVFYVQLQLKVIDTADNNKEKLYAEFDGSNFVFHDIQYYGKLYHFTWQPSWLTDTRYKVKKIRIRITGPGEQPPELWLRGSWNIDNVMAIGGSTFNNTNPGSNVQINLGSGVNVTFDNVTGAGNTSLTTSSSGTPPPGGFSIVPIGSPTYYSITTTATFTGNITIWIQYNDAGLTAQQEAALKLQVYEQPPGQWKNITSLLDINTNIICGVVTHLSEFAVMFSSGGTTNQWVLTNQPTNGGINCFTLSGTNLYAGTEAGGVLFSPDNGGTWSKVNNGLTNLTVRALCSNGIYVFAGTWGGGVFRTSNNGASWSPVNTGLSDLAVSSLYANETNILAGTWGGGVFLSTNSGSSWTPMNSGLTETHIRSLLIKWGNFFAGTINGLFLFLSSSTSWQTMNAGLTNTAAISLASMADNAAEELFTGTDGGGVFMITTSTNWTAINNGLTNLHIPYLCFASSHLFAATWGGGVFYASKPWTAWTAINDGLTNLYARTLITSSTNIFAGTSDGSIWRRSLSDLITEMPDIASNPPSWDYGSVAVGNNVDKTFVIKNEGTANLIVTGSTLTGPNAMEFSIQTGGGSFVLAPGATQDIKIKFAPTGTGSKSAALSISSNDPDENPLLIPLSGSGTSVSGIPINPVTTTPQMAGIEFWVTIEVGTNANPVTDLFGISFDLNYTNTNYINYVAAEAGSFIGTDVIFYPTPDDPNGKVSIGISRKAPQAGVNGFGTVARIKLVADPATPNNTSIQLMISNVAANNSAGATISLLPGKLNITIQSGLIVWPGDTNNNGTVDQADVLPLGLHWGKTGPARPNASMTWLGQLVTPWNPQAATYADATGDGAVNQADVLPIGLNWNKTHTTTLAKPGVNVAQANKSTATNLTIAITGDTNPDKDFFIDIFVNNVTNLFGLSFELIYTPSAFVDPLTAESGNDNLMGTDLIYFSMINKKAGIDTGKVAVGISRKSGQGGVTGTGLVTRIKAHMAPTALSGSSTTSLSLQNIMANDVNGNPIAIDTCFFKLITGAAVANVSGAVTYCQNSIPVENATITLDGYTTTTGTDGSFSFKSIPGGNLTLTPSKTGDLGSSISAYDASMVLRYSVGLIMLTPYQSIAADVSGNGSVTAYDASVILRYTVGLISSFPVGADWKFVPNSFAIDASNWNTAPGSIMYSPLNSDQTNQDFTGIVYGDVSGNWTQLNLAKSYAGNTSVKFGDVVCVSSDEFIVPIETNVSGQMFSAKIEVQFEDDVINFQEVLLSEKFKDYAECHNVQAGYLTIALAGIGGFELEKDFLSLKFIARNAEEKRPGTLKIVDAMVNEGPIAIDSRNGNISINHTLPSTYQLEQNYPNPFNSTTTIAYQLPQPAKVLLAIYDVQGNEIRILLHEHKSAGHYVANWDGLDAAGNEVASGIYFYKLAANQFNVTKKCLLIK